MMSAFLFWVGMVWAGNPVWEDLGGGTKVDWAGERLVSTASSSRGTGHQEPFEVLEGRAREVLGPTVLQRARKVRLTSTRTAGEFMESGDLVADRLDDNLSSWDASEVRYRTSGIVEVDAVLDLHDWMRSALTLLATGRERASPVTGETTGVVLDARAHDVRPCIAPRVLDPSGGVVYGLEVVAPGTMALRSPVQWVDDAADVRAAQRAGEHPLFVRVASVKDGCDLVVSAPDAESIRTAAEATAFLVQAHVVAVVRP